ncbi:helix-turn-helix domain-containing protein [Fervidibacillus albus]|uniref:Helix-turn-helix domain-containing protein n=1 Tax=Fervidibacillus albus TaxID=2980026 RepID=A0A9E8RYQ8_9BACI|nr:helix-turn-helix transcriptional regulator [Fervidibacillus albus]WAA10907.1 helix-turn-helix domain-containing protein [Fervidibacillus albus]
MIDDVQVGQLMQEMRKKNGFTSVQMAEKLRISQPKLSRMETGNQPVPISLLSRFCIICQISLVDFFQLLEENTYFHHYIREERAEYEVNGNSRTNRTFIDLTKDERDAICHLVYTFKSGKTSD